MAASIAVGDAGIVPEKFLGVLAPLTETLAVVREPGAGLLHDTGLDAEVDQLAGLGDALAVHDVELDLLERRRQLVLDHLHAGLVADHLVALLDRADAADVEADRGVEFQRVAAAGGLRVAEHHADLHADLIDEDDHGVGARDRAGELPERLAHQARLKAGELVAHLALDLGARRQRGDRIDDQNVDRAGAHQRIGDLKRLLAGIGLRDQEIVEVDAELARVDRVERVLGVDEAADAALLLRLGDRVKRERRLARRFGPVNFDDAAARQPADAEGDVEAEGAGGHRRDLDRRRALAEPHDRAFAETALDLAQRRIERLRLVHGLTLDHPKRRSRHRSRSLFHENRGVTNNGRTTESPSHAGQCTLFVLVGKGQSDRVELPRIECLSLKSDRSSL